MSEFEKIQRYILTHNGMKKFEKPFEGGWISYADFLKKIDEARREFPLDLPNFWRSRAFPIMSKEGKDAREWFERWFSDGEQEK